MDIGLIVGIILGFLLIALGIATSGGAVTAFLESSSIMIVLGGTIAATFVNFKWDQLSSMVGLLRVALFGRPAPVREAIGQLVQFAAKARREGLLAMEEEAEKIEDPFLRKGLRLVVDGTDPETVRQILDIELTFLEERHRTGQQIFEFMGGVAPAFGMLGTLIGLIIMLGNLDNPDTIGPAMAVALITTFYGVLFANLLFLPLAGKLRAKSEDEVQLREVMIEGILSIQAGENPLIVEQKLESFLSPRARVAMREDVRRERAAEAERAAATGVR